MRCLHRACEQGPCPARSPTPPPQAPADQYHLVSTFKMAAVQAIQHLAGYVTSERMANMAIKSSFDINL